MNFGSYHQILGLGVFFERFMDLETRSGFFKKNLAIFDQLHPRKQVWEPISAQNQ